VANRSSAGSGPFGGPFFVTFNTIEDSVIHGGATVEGYNGFWMGFIRNTVYGTVNLNDNRLTDEDGNEYVTNTIYGSLNCDGNKPEAQVGDGRLTEPGDRPCHRRVRSGRLSRETRSGKLRPPRTALRRQFRRACEATS
jgi:hypothetical protein